jgi:hypothetical protein
LGAEVAAESLPAIQKVDDLIDSELPPPRADPVNGVADDDAHPEDADMQLPESPDEAEGAVLALREMDI